MSSQPLALEAAAAAPSEHEQEHGPLAHSSSSNNNSQHQGLIASFRQRFLGGSGNAAKRTDNDAEGEEEEEDGEAGEEEEVFSNPSDALDADGEGYFSDGTGATSSTSDAGPGSPGSGSSTRGAMNPSNRMPLLGLQGFVGLGGTGTGTGTGFNPANLQIASEKLKEMHEEEEEVEEQKRIQALGAANRPELNADQHRTSTIRGRSLQHHSQEPQQQQQRELLMPSRTSTIIPSYSHSPFTSGNNHSSPSLQLTPLPPANELPSDPELAESLMRSLFVVPPVIPSSSPASSHFVVPLPPTSPAASPAASASAGGGGGQGGSSSVNVSPQLQARRLNRAGVPLSPTTSRNINTNANTAASSYPRQHAHTASSPAALATAAFSRSAAASVSSAASAGSGAAAAGAGAAGVGRSPRSSSPAPLALYDTGAASAVPGAESTSAQSRSASRRASVMLATPAENSSLMNLSLTGSASMSTPSIFERDIEHRNTSHLLTKSEAIDVAIPSVLSDAVEALQEYAPEDLEIVEPQAAAPPALSTLALSSHTLNTEAAEAAAAATAAEAAGAVGGIGMTSDSLPGFDSAPSPPLSYASLSVDNLEEPPAGSLAAQIAEKLAPSSNHRSGHAAPSSAVSEPGSGAQSPLSGAGGARSAANPASSTSSIASGTRSPHRSPTRSAFATPGKASPRPKKVTLPPPPPVTEPPVSSSFVAPAPFQPHAHMPVRAGSPSNAAPAMLSNSLLATSAPTLTPSPSELNGPFTTAAAFPSRLTPQLPTAPNASSPSGSSPLPTAMAFPALPLPNPYRSPSPPPNMTAESERPAQTSISVDGAVISGMESATAQASLDGLADVITANAPVAFPNGGSAEEMAPYSTRGGGSPILERRVARLSGFTNGGSGSQAAAAGRAPSPSASRTPQIAGTYTPTSTGAGAHFPAKRLSFFSAADMINSAKGEVHTFDEAVAASAETDVHQHGLGLALHTTDVAAPVPMPVSHSLTSSGALQSGIIPSRKSASSGASIAKTMFGNGFGNGFGDSMGPTSSLEQRLESYQQAAANITPQRD